MRQGQSGWLPRAAEAVCNTHNLHTEKHSFSNKPADQDAASAEPTTVAAGMPSGAAQTQLHGGISGDGGRGPGTWKRHHLLRAIHCNGETPQIRQAASKCLASLGDSSAHQRSEIRHQLVSSRPGSLHAGRRWDAALGRARQGPLGGFQKAGRCFSQLFVCPCSWGALSVFRGSNRPGPSRVISCTHSCRNLVQMKTPASHTCLSMHRSMPDSRHPQPILETRQHQLMAASVRTP